MLEHSDIVKKISDEFPSPLKKDWLVVAEKSLKGKSFEKISSLNYEGVYVQPIYSKEDIEALEQIINSAPGIFPFVRGKSFDGYKGKSWDISQPIVAKDAEEFNRKLRDYLSRGQTAVTVKLGDGKDVGINFFPTSSAEFGEAFTGIDLKGVPINLFVGRRALDYLEIFDNFIEVNGLRWSDIQGGLDFDPIGDLATDGIMNATFESVFDGLKKYLRKMGNSGFYPIGVSGMVYREGGADAVQEVAFVLATCVFYLRSLLDDFDIDDLARRIRLILSTGSDFFVEIGKIRAIRMLWAKVIEEFGGNLESQKANIYVKSLEMNKSSLDIYVNMLRNTTEALASIIGGCDALELLNFDVGGNKQFFGKLMVANGKQRSIEFSERVTRNTQLVLAEECFLKEVTDPAGGSYYIEYLTNEIGSKSWALFQEVEKRGGILEALKLGFPQDEVGKVRTKRVKNLATRKDVVLGANKYPNLLEELIIVSDGSKGLEDKGETPAELNQKKHISEKKYEVTGTKIVPIEKFRVSEVFENLRMKALEFQKKTGRKAKVFICAMGPLSKHKARVDFAMDFLHVGGIEAEYNGGFSSYEDAARVFLESGLNVVVFCSTDEIYGEFVPQLSRLLKKAKPNMKIILAGYPVDKIEEYRAAGVDEFIHIKADVVKVLEGIYSDLI